jgi:Zn-dependent protease/CBS domain-containing protein
MNGTLFAGAWRVATILGIPIRVHFSWFIVFGLITWSLSTAYFPRVAPDLPAASYWIKGVLAALLLFASVGFHELAHSLVARRYHLAIESITLFIFGGVAQMKSEPPHPRAEFMIAIAGPLSSLLLAGVFLSLSVTTAGGIKALFAYLAQINFIVAVFNLIPGFPMDGGRVLRSILWGRRNNYFSATQTASSVGQKIAMFFIIYGVLSVFVGLPGGLWLMLIGWFLYTAAQASYQRSTLQESLAGVAVRDVMVKDVVALTVGLSIRDAVDHYFLRYGYGGFPVMDDGNFLGFVTLKAVKDVPQDQWGTVKIGEVVAPHQKRWEIAPDDEAMKALELMLREDQGRLVVLDHGKVTGLITRNGLARYVQIVGK